MDVREKAVAYLSSRPRTRQEVVRYLTEKGFDEDEILETVDELEQYHYVDDLAYSKMYFEQGFQKGRGKSRLSRELAQRGVNSNIIEIAYEELDDIPDEFEMALAIAYDVVCKVDTQDLEYDDKKRLEGKIGRKLAGRGFTMNTIHKVIGRLLY